MLAVLLEKFDEKLVASLSFQRCKDFKVYVPKEADWLADYEAGLLVAHGGLNDVQEPLVCFLEPGAVPDKHFVGRVLRAARWHKHFDVFHVNLSAGKAFPCRLKAARFFKWALVEARPVPLSSFIFRTEKLRERAVFRADGSLNPIPTILASAQERPIRSVWLEKLEWIAPAVPQDPVSVEQRLLDRLEVLRWTEYYYGEDNYPIGVGDRLDLFAREIARLYPLYTPEQMKEQMNLFRASEGTIRKVRAASALKNAIRKRQVELQ